MPETAVLRLPLPHHRVEIELLHAAGGVEQAAVGEGRHPRLARRLGLAAAGADGYVTEGAAGRPVALAALAEVPGLVDVVVVEVTEFGLHAFAPRAWDDLLRPLLRRRIGFLRWLEVVVILIWIPFWLYSFF